MPAPLNVVTAFNTTSQAVTDALEHVYATLIIPEVPTPETTVSILAILAVLEGTNGTDIRLRIRRNTLTGTLVSAVMINSIAAAAYEIVHVVCDDVPGDVAQQAYVITALQTACTAAGAVQSVWAYALIH